MHAAIAGLVGDKRAAAFLSTIKTRMHPLAAEEILTAYDRQRPQFLEWIKTGRLDLVQGSLLALEKRLQAKRNYEEEKRNHRHWKRLGAFMGDLPGDLRDQAENFFAERSYILPPTKRK